jgi:uncharacterized protein (TIGR03083 family)
MGLSAASPLMGRRRPRIVPHNDAMPTGLTIEAQLATIAREGERFAVLAERVDPECVVPTCPGWTVRELLAHQGEVHRWATDTLTGQWDELSAADQADRVAAPLPPALVPWFRDGVAGLVTALEAAPNNLVAPVFLRDAPSPRLFWARRQANETTIHRVDALAAVLGRQPLAAETGIGVAEAIDGIDELLCGFIPRSKTRLRSPEPFTVAVEPSDSDRRWVLAISDRPVVTVESVAAADATFSGTAVELYLGVWNRGNELRVSGRPGVLEQWRAQMRVSWL